MKLCKPIAAVLALLLLTGCASKSIGVIGGADESTSIIVSDESADGKETAMGYQQITQEAAKKIMDHETGFVILDVREQYEFDEGHIPGAIVLPYTQVDELAPELLPDKGQMILVYCRSGKRSKIAAEALAGLGYSDVREFGGIIDWPYDVVTD